MEFANIIFEWLYYKNIQKAPLPEENCYLWHLSNEKQMVHCAFCNDCHEETDFSVIVFIENDLTKLINKKTRKKCRKSRCFMLAPRAKPAARVSIPTNKLQSKCCVNKQFLNLAKLTFSIYHFRSHLLAK